MKKDTEITEVRFYMEPALDKGQPRTCMAYFPNDIATGNGNRTCYAHIGQHSSCDPAYLKRCRKATPEQYKDLKSELESLGYNLKVK